MPSTAETVIARVLRRKTPTAAAVLDELARAGCTITDPDPVEPPAWLPKDDVGRNIVLQVADLVREGKTAEDIVTQTGKSKRMVDRYVAAALHLGWVRRRPQRATRRAPS